MKAKVCKKCGVEKDIVEFYKHVKIKDGIRNQCIKCCSNYNKKYYKNNPEKNKNMTKRWRENNKEKYRAYAREWERNNPDKIRKYKKKSKEKYPERVRNERNKWKQKYPEKYRYLTKIWKQNNRDRINQLEKIKSENMTDFYIKKLLGLSDPPKELIELKRQQLKIKRTIKNNEHENYKC